jgi:hypothetical protein
MKAYGRVELHACLTSAPFRVFISVPLGDPRAGVLLVVVRKVFARFKVIRSVTGM